VLDLGCGDGAFCRFAAGLGAAVHGLDAEPEAIEQALAAVPDGDFRLGLMEHVPWRANSFDVVTAFNSVQYALDPELALAEGARVARPSGALAVCKWGAPPENAFFAFLAEVGAGGLRSDELPVTDPVADAIRAVRLEVLDTGDVPAPIVMADDAALETALVRAGIDADPFAASGSGDVIEAAARYRLPDGSYRFDNRLRYWLLRPR
jgi:SAM-dependent methyltransferase